MAAALPMKGQTQWEERGDNIAGKPQCTDIWRPEVGVKEGQCTDIWRPEVGVREAQCTDIWRPEVGVTLGSTGIGVQGGVMIGEALRIRGEASVMARFEHTMHFDVQVGEQNESKYDANGQRRETKFDRLSKKLKEVTGYEVDEQVDMVGKPTYWNVGLLVDWFPFKQNRHWYVTGGVMYGNRIIAEAVNSIHDAATLVGVNFYNNMYQKIEEGEPIMEVNQRPIYLDVEQEEKILSYGRMGIHVGDYKYDQTTTDGTVTAKAGQAYLMEPDEDCTVSATIHVNRWKPYLGIGYQGRLLKGNDQFMIGFDGGVLFWGGTPSIVTHDGTNLSKDVDNIRGKVGDYVDLISSFKVMPVLRVTLSKKF